jgi:hypothetical protein
MNSSPVAGGLYGTDGQSLYLIDKSTGGATLIGSHGPVEYAIGGLAFDSDGILYGMSLLDIAQLYTIDTGTGAATAIGPIGIGFIFEGGLAFGPNGVLYGVDSGSAVDARTFTIDPGTGAGQIIGPSQGQSRDINGMAFDGNKMYAMDRVSDTVGTLDILTGSYQPIGYPGSYVGGIGGASVDPASNDLYAVFGDGSFYILDKGSGNGTCLGTTPAVYGLAFAPTGEALTADTDEISAQTGGQVTFTLTAGNANADRGYILLGSISGTTPGINLPGGLVTLPLHWDIFTSLVIGLINTPVFSNFMGQLDSTGMASSKFDTLGPIPGAAGLTMYFAYALNNPWDFVSNPVGIEIVP